MRRGRRDGDRAEVNLAMNVSNELGRRRKEGLVCGRLAVADDHATALGCGSELRAGERLTGFVQPHLVGLRSSESASSL
jgi:hypothetical protein